MGIDYLIFPVLRDPDRLRAMRDRELAWLAPVIGSGSGGVWDWLANPTLGLEPAREGRFPTPLEVREVLRSLAGLRYEISQHIPPDGGSGWWNAGWWDASVRTYYDMDEHSTIHFPRYSGSEAAPQAFYFAKGSWDLNLFLAEEIARVCGPLLFWPDSEEGPTHLFWPDGVQRPAHLVPGTETRVYRAVPAPGGGRLVRWMDERIVLSKTFSPLVPYPDPEYCGLVPYLDALGAPRPPLTRRGRLATYGELMGVLESMQPWAQIGEQHEGVEWVRRTLYVGDSGARRPVARVVYRDWGFEEEPQSADAGEPIPLYFEAGDMRAEVTIIERLARHCGPQVLLVPHGSSLPLVVQPGDDPEALTTRWERLDAEIRQLGSPP